MTIAYFVHNVDDAAVLKRIELLRLGGAPVRLTGFKRFDDKDGPSGPLNPVILGRTQDGQFFKRLVQVAGHLLRPGQLIALVDNCEAIICRNLEMLILGYGIKRLARSNVPLNYESLDIHRLLLGKGLKSFVLRRLERFLLGKTSALITSSPAFVDNYFSSVQKYRGHICLIENKVLDHTGALPAQNARAAPPWVIGWFGIIRCRKSLEMLREIVRAFPMIRVVISGRVAEKEFDNFHERVRETPGLTFTGPYRADELASVYGQAHFVWAIDYFEEGENSKWLLPNRLYDSLAFGCLPIAVDGVETANWLKAHKAGVVVNSPVRDLGAFFTDLTRADYNRLLEDARRIEPSDYIHTAASAKQLVSAVVKETGQ